MGRGSCPSGLEPDGTRFLRNPARCHEKYRHFGERDNFAVFDRQKVSILTELIEEPIVAGGSFLDDAANGKLRDVSWIDPNFTDLKVLEAASNDDHPPSDVRAGQSLVLGLRSATQQPPMGGHAARDRLRRARRVDDHVSPPSLDVEDGSGYATYGVRVPSLLVGPRVVRQVCHEQFDHTSPIKTVLRAKWMYACSTRSTSE